MRLWFCGLVFCVLSGAAPHCLAAGEHRDDGDSPRHQWGKDKEDEEGGYATPMSVKRGDTVQLHISTARPEVDIKIYHWESYPKLYKTFSDVRCKLHEVRDSAFRYGCNWPVTVSLAIPSTWPGGVYDAEFVGTAGVKKRVTFVVRESHPGNYSRICVSLPVSTWEAYNNFGGKSLYNFNSTENRQSYAVSFERPFIDSTGAWVDQSYFRWGVKLTSWLSMQGIRVEYILNTDLDRDSALLDPYDVFVVVGHDEYWSRKERTAVEGFIADGKRFMVLGGNTCWWQSRVEENGAELVCYKNYAIDPHYPHQLGTITDLWRKWPVSNCENTFTGASWQYGGLVNQDTFYTHEQGYGDYGVWNSHHWVYEGTALEDGQTFGYRDAIVGYEVDGALMLWKNGIPTVTSDDSTPPNFQILGMSPATVEANPSNHLHATMGIFRTPSGGAVFNAATTNWIDGLAHDFTVSRITRNVFDHFASGKFPPEITAWSPSRIVSDSLHHDQIYTNSRKITIPAGQSVSFAVAANDPNGGPVGYSWVVNGMHVSTDSVFRWTPPENAGSAPSYVWVFVHGVDDTASMFWTVYTAALKIVSRPKDTLQTPEGVFRYKVDVAGYYADTTRYTLLDAPSWVTIDDSGIVRAVAPHLPGTYLVRVRAADDHGNSDTQRFALRIPGFTSARAREVQPRPSALTMFPNPCHSYVTFRCAVPAGCRASLGIYDSEGRLLRSLQPVGDEIRAIFWDGTNDSGKPVSSGEYIAELSYQPAGDPRSHVERQLVVMAR